MVKRVSEVAAWIVAFLVTMPILNMAFGWISAPDDMLVVVGMATVIVVGMVWVIVVGKRVSAFVAKYSKGVALLMLMAMAVFSGAACTTVPAGHVGLKVNSYGQQRGVQDVPAVTGMVWYNPITTNVYVYPTFVQNASWTVNVNEGNPVNEEITFNTADSLTVKADITLAYQLIAEKAPAFYVKFRADDINSWTHGFLRNKARTTFDEIAGKYRVDQIMGDNAPFLKEVRDALQKDIDQYGVKLENLGFSGSPRPPDGVVRAINEKVTATQIAIRIENELRGVEAEQKKSVAQAEGAAKARIASAEGDAKANAILSASITDRIMEWKRMDIQWATVSKWNGTLPGVSVTGNGTAPAIMLPSSIIK